MYDNKNDGGKCVTLRELGIYMDNGSMRYDEYEEVLTYGHRVWIAGGCMCTDGGPDWRQFQDRCICTCMYICTCRSHHVPKLGGNADLVLIYVAVDSLGNVLFTFRQL